MTKEKRQSGRITIADDLKECDIERARDRFLTLLIQTRSKKLYRSYYYFSVFDRLYFNTVKNKNAAWPCVCIHFFLNRFHGSPHVRL